MGAVGLKNLGNTCYMNSGLQCLSHTKELTQYFLSSQYEADLNEDNTLGSKGKLLNAYANLIFKTWHGRMKVVSPNKFKYELSNFYSSFEGYGQHDSQEFISHLLDGLHEDVNLIKKKPLTNAVEWKEGQSDLSVGRESWKTFLKRNYSEIMRLFYGQFRSEIKCPTCDNLSITFDPFQLVSLPVPVCSTKFVSIYAIPVNHADSAKIVKFKLRFSENSETLQSMYDAYITEYEATPGSFYISFSAFTTHGTLIPTDTPLSKIVS